MNDPRTPCPTWPTHSLEPVFYRRKDTQSRIQEKFMKCQSLNIFHFLSHFKTRQSSMNQNQCYSKKLEAPLYKKREM